MLSFLLRRDSAKPWLGRCCRPKFLKISGISGFIIARPYLCIKQHRQIMSYVLFLYYHSAALILSKILPICSF